MLALKSKILIVIPVKNADKHIRKCLDALLTQESWKNKLDIVVVDNRSTDNTVSYVKEYSKNVRIVSKNTGTIGALRNYGARFGTSKIVAFLDGDCIVDRRWVMEGLNILQEKEVSCVGFKAALPDDATSWVTRTWELISSSSKHEGTCYVSWLSSFNLMLKREYFEKIGGFNEELETCEDVDLGQRLGEISKIVFSDKTQVIHLGVVGTLIELFFKELWRGKNNFKAFLISKNKLGDVLSVFLPFCYLVVTIVSLLSLFLSTQLFWFGFSGLIFVPLGLALRKLKKGDCRHLPSMILLYIVYLLARGIALLRRERVS